MHPVDFQIAFFTEPHDKQKVILNSTAKNKIVACGRRFGKSKLVCREWMRGALTNEFHKQVIIAPIFKQALLDLEIMRSEIYSSQINIYIDKIITTPYPKIIFKNGAFIDFGSADNFDSIRGTSYDRLCLDEAGFIKDEAMTAIRPLIFDTGAPFWKIGTPNGKNHFYEDFMDKHKDFQSFQFSTFENPYIQREEVDKEIERYGKESLYVRTEIFAEFLEDQNAVFPWVDIMACIDNSLFINSKYMPNRKYAMGVDLAKYEDFTVIIILDYTAEPYKIVYYERFNRRPWQYVIERIKDINIQYNCNSNFIDSTGVGDPIVEALQGKMSAEGYKFSSTSKLDLVTYLAGFIINHKLRYPNIQDLIDELKYFQFVKSEHSNNWKMEASTGYHDDTVMALGLALMASKNSRPLYFGNLAKPNLK
jgi:phage FluMu gp28-like protein